MKNPPVHPLIDKIRQGASPDLNAIVSAFAGQLPLLTRLKDTPQDPEWHAEGDVHIHTSLVLGEMYALLERAQIKAEERLVLVLAAALHDIAKPLTTRTRFIEGRERITSPGHANKGRSYIAYKLLGLGVAPETARQVMALVGHHHDPKQLVKRDAPRSRYTRLARLAPLHQLYWLEQADLRGRMSKDLNEQLDTLELFGLIAKELGLWNTRDPYQDWRAFIEGKLESFPQATQNLVVANAIRDYEQGLIYTPEEALARSYRYRDAYASLVVTCGPSGAGKSSWVQKNYSHYELISLDQLRLELTGKREDQSMNGQVIQLARERLKDCFRNHRDVVWDATNLVRAQRNSVLQTGFDYGASVTLAVFHLPEMLIVQQNSEREHPVPVQVLGRQLGNLDFPYLDETHHTIYNSQGSFVVI